MSSLSHHAFYKHRYQVLLIYLEFKFRETKILFICPILGNRLMSFLEKEVQLAIFRLKWSNKCFTLKSSSSICSGGKPPKRSSSCPLATIYHDHCQLWKKVDDLFEPFTPLTTTLWRWPRNFFSARTTFYWTFSRI